MVFQTLQSRAGWLGLAMTASFCILIGCSNTEPPPDVNNSVPKSGAPPATSSATTGASTSTASNDPGQQVFNANCARCHVMNGVGGKMGPDLSHAGADPKRTPEWLTTFIKNPKSSNPNSRMPSFEGKISDDDMKALTTYLAGLK